MRKSDVEDLSQDGATGIVKSIGVEGNPNDALINDSIAVRVEITLKMLGQSALDRFCHRAHQFVIDGESYRKRMAPAASSSVPSKTGRKTTA